MSLVLSPDEIKEITHYTRPAEQLRELAKLGIPAKKRTCDGTPCVLRMHLIAASASAGPQAEPSQPKIKPRSKNGA